MSHRTLSETNSLNSNQLVIERQIQMTFFHSCMYILGRLDTICTDVGQTMDVNGAVDFYVVCTEAKYKWAIEIARNSIKLDEHVQRFDRDRGMYRNLPATEWVVIDFVQVEVLPAEYNIRHDYNCVYTVYWTDKDNHIIIYTPNQQIPIPQLFVGDDVFTDT